jgi:hypothetical protein
MVVRVDNSQARRRDSRRLVPALALLGGALAGIVAVLLAGTAIAQRTGPKLAEPLLEATHLPPLLTTLGERVELRYDAFCVVPEATTEAPCELEGAVFVRPGEAGPFRDVQLRDDGAATDGRFSAVVPSTIARAPGGFSYYAVLQSPSNGASVTIPAGGAAAPQQSHPLLRPVRVTVGEHAFGQTRPATARVVEAAWGSGPSEVGLEQGRSLQAIGGSSLDVGADGTVHVLDEANKRVLRWRAGERRPESVPLAINGTLADMSVAGDGTTYVLETTATDGGPTLLRSFDANGDPKDAVEMAERASQVRVGPDGPVVLQNLSGQWKRSGDDENLFGPSGQRNFGRPGRPLRGGGEIVTLRRDNEVRAALLGPAGVARAWRVTSETPLAEVQLAEPLGNGLVLVVRTYNDTRDEFVVLTLGDRGLVDRFAVRSSDWAESAPLSRFRLVGSSLYQLGSTSSKLFVDRFDLETK